MTEVARAVRPPAGKWEDLADALGAPLEWTSGTVRR